MTGQTETAIAGLKPDLIAGLTAAAVVLPKAMAYATVAGLPVAAGLYTALVPMVVYAVLGTSRVLSVSSTATLAILAGAQLALAVPDGDPARLATAAATLAALTGALLLLASVLRLGFVANFISAPVLTGFKAGIGLVIVLDQVPKLLGIHITKEGFFRDILSIVHHLPDTSLLTLAIAAVTLLLLAGLERRWPHSPAPLIAVAGGIAASWIFGLQALGVGAVGTIPQGLPSLTLPDPGLVRVLLPGALGIALMSFTETIAAARAFVATGEPVLRPNQELLATGLANAAGAWFGGMPAGGGTSQTAVKRNAGARSQGASVVVAAVAFATILFLGPVLALLPNAPLAAVVIAYSIGLVSPHEMLAIRRVRTMEFRWTLAACLGVMVLGTLKGILVAALLSLLSLVALANDPPVQALVRKPGTRIWRPRSGENPQDESIAGLLVVRPEGRAYFGNAAAMGEKILALVHEAHPKVLLIDASAIPGLEYTALKMLVEAEARLADEGVQLWLAALTPESLELVRRTSLATTLGHERMFFNVDSAADAFVARGFAP